MSWRLGILDLKIGRAFSNSLLGKKEWKMIRFSNKKSNISNIVYSSLVLDVWIDTTVMLGLETRAAAISAFIWITTGNRILSTAVQFPVFLRTWLKFIEVQWWGIPMALVSPSARGSSLARGNPLARESPSAWISFDILNEIISGSWMF